MLKNLRKRLAMAIYPEGWKPMGDGSSKICPEARAQINVAVRQVPMIQHRLEEGAIKDIRNARRKINGTDLLKAMETEASL